MTDTQKKSVTLFERQIDGIEELQQAKPELDHFSEALREVLDRGLEYEDLLQEKEELENEVGRLQDRIKALTGKMEENSELVEYVSEEKKLQKKRERLRRQREKAGAATRMKWWLFGRSIPEK